jgi:hypothetical protein
MSQAGTRQMLEGLKRTIEAEIAAGHRPYALGLYHRILARYKAEYGMKETLITKQDVCK